MKGHRSPGQTLVAVPIRENLLDLLDEARLEVAETRAAFVRKAIIEKLQSLGYEIDLKLAAAPDRAGGRKVDADDDELLKGIPPSRGDASEQRAKRSA